METIIKSKNEYVIKVKQNQKSLYNTITEIRNHEEKLDSIIIKERNRGRIEKRTIKTYNVNDYIKNLWKGAKTIIYVIRERTKKGEKSISHSYYISSLRVKAKRFAVGIRHHWGIENRLHYVKDVTLKEDASKIKKGNAPQILSLVRNLILNVARINGENRVRKFMRQCCANIIFTAKLLE